MLGRALLSILLLALVQCPAFGQSVGVAAATLRGAAEYPLADQIATNGGVLVDFPNNTFLTQVPGSTSPPTVYASFAGMFTGLSGSITSSAKWIYNVSGVMVQVPANTVAAPCYSHDQVLLGICVEAVASTNNLLWSEDYTQAAWTKTGVGVTADNASAPTNALTASTITEDTSNGPHALAQTITSLGTNALAYVASCYVQSGGGAQRQVYIQAVDGSGNGTQVIFPFYDRSAAPTINGQGTPFTVSNTWMDQAGASPFVRVSVAFTKNSSTSLTITCGMADAGGNVGYTGDGVSSLIMWGIECKQNSGGALVQTETFPSSYVPTTSAKVTRAADVVALPLPSSMVGTTPYSIYAQVGMSRAAGPQPIFVSLNDASDAQRIYMYQGNSTFSYNFQIHIDGAGSTTLSAAPNGVFDQQIGLALVAAPGAYWYENSAQGTITSTTTNYFTDAVTRIRLGTYNPTVTTVGSKGSINTLAVFPVAMDHGVMQSFLFQSPAFNPDTITGPNYMSQSMLSSVSPASPPFEILHGPAGLPASDSVPNTSYSYLPTTLAYAGDITASQGSTFSTAKYGWLQWTNRCSAAVPSTYTGSISGTTLTVTAISSGTVGSGRVLTGTGIAANTMITGFLTGQGGTGTYSINNSQTAASTSISQAACLTAKSYNTPPGPGFATSDGSSVSLDYSSYETANAATLMEALYVNNYPSHATGPCPAGQVYCGYLDPVNAVGIADGAVITYNYAVQNADTVFPNRFTVNARTWAYNTNTFVLPNGAFGAGTATAWGTVADFEMADNRLASNTLWLVQQLALIHHNASTPLKYGILPDPLGGAAKLAGLCGIGLINPSANCDMTNLAQVATAVDYFNVLVENPAPFGWSFSASLTNYYAMFGTPTVDFPPSHLGLAMVMGTWPGGTTIQNAQDVQTFIVTNGLGGTQTGPIAGQCSRFTVQKWLTLLGLSTTCPP